MSVVLPRGFIARVSQASDPKKAILEAITPHLKDIEVMYNMVLVAIYIRPEKTKGGIFRPDSNVEEDTYQGKVGLVVKLGPNAFEDDYSFSFRGQRADVSEWCVYKFGDAWSVSVNGCACRLVADSNIRMKVKNPESVF